MLFTIRQYKPRQEFKKQQATQISQTEASNT